MSVVEALRNKNIVTIMRQSWAIGWPMTLIMFAIFLTGFADVYVAGKFGKEIQAAYGLAYQIFFVSSIVGFALTVGGVSVTSMLFAGSKPREYEQAVSTLFISAGISGLIIGAVLSKASSGIIAVFPLPEILKSYTVPLLRIYATGAAAHFILVNMNAVLRASGRVRNSLVTMIVVCGLNIPLNFYLAFHTPLGYQGIGWATVLSTLCGLGLNMFFLRGVIFRAARFSRAFLGRILHISWPAGLLQIFWQLGAMALYAILGLMPEHRVEILAAFTNGLKIEAAIFLPAFAFNMANAVMMGKLTGERRCEDAFHSGLMTAALGSIVVTLMTLTVMAAAPRIAGFLSDNPIVVAECTRYIYISLLFEPIMAWGVILSGGLNGVGDTRSVMRIISLSIWMVRVPVSYFFGVISGIGPVAVWWAMNLSILCQTIFITRHFYSRRWETCKTAEAVV